MQEFEITRHLVVELKAADIILGRDELNQVEDYANVVLSNPAFATDKARWDFILVGTDYNAVVANRFANDGRALGQVLAPEPVSGGPQIRVHVRRWRDIINENRRRSNFMTSNLEHDPTFERARSQDIL